MHVVRNADSGDPAAPRDAARSGRAAAMQRRRQLARGKQALNGGDDRTAATGRAGAPAFTVHRGGAG